MRIDRNGVAVAAVVFSVLMGSAGCAGANRGERPKPGSRTEAQAVSAEEARGEAAAGAEKDAPEGGAEEAAKATAAEKAGGRLRFWEAGLVKKEALELCEEYAALVEGAAEGQVFEAAEEGRERELEEMLLSHYEVAGRSSGEGREYYLAARRKDAPVYDDFGELSVGYLDDVCQVGYSKGEKGDYGERILYQVPGWTVGIPGGNWSEDSLDVLCFWDDGEQDPAFLASFSEEGRKMLAFIKEHKGLSFHEEGKACIDFLYQDEDTVGFWSEPYPCCIALKEEEAGHLRQLLGKEDAGGKRQKVFGRYGDALDYVRTLDGSIRTTGASFCLDGRDYQLLGSRGQEGYLLSWEETEDGGGETRLEQHLEAWRYVRGRVLESVGRDYGDFTEAWFDVPLVRATLEFPRLEQAEGGTLRFEACVQEVEDPEKLKELSRIMGNAIRGHEVISGCPYNGILKLSRKDGETLLMFVATDSCDSVTYEGRIGFEYGRQEELAAIFGEAMGTGN